MQNQIAEENFENARLRRRKSTPGSFHSPTSQPPTTEIRVSEPKILDWGTPQSSRRQYRWSGFSASQDDDRSAGIDCRFCRQAMADSRGQATARHDFLWQHHTPPSPEACNALFHGPCPTCEPADPANQSNLCDFCRHLRLGHLFSCTDESFDLSLCYPLDLDESTCSLCHFVARSRKAHGLDHEFCAIARLPRGAFGGDFQPDNAHLHPASSYRYNSLLFADSSRSTQSNGADSEIQKTSLPGLVRDQDWPVIKSWIDECTSDHLGCRLELARPSVPGLWLVDVSNMCIVEASSEESFVALSYVRGRIQSPAWLRATKSSVEPLGQPGSLDPTRLPQTVKDAIQACRKLGEQYLWVDQLCIVQDDEESMQHQIGRMGSIYSSAKFVIVDATGKSMDDGLAGLSRERTATSQTTVDGIQYHWAPEDRRSANHLSPWASRAWTLQENVLAKRKLFFARNQLFFECVHHSKFENVLTEGSFSEQYERTLRVRRVVLKQRNGSLKSLLRMYRTRDLTHDSDVLNAFSGILESFGAPENFLYGHPCADFDQWLLWHPEGRSRRRKTLQTFVEDPISPTWSWPSFIGETNFADYRGPAFCGPLVSWGYDTAGEFREIRATSPKGLSPSWRKAMAIAWGRGCIASPFSAVQPITAMDDRAYWKYSSERWPTFGDFWSEAFTAAPAPSEKDIRSLDPFPSRETNIGPGQLSTVAQCARFGLGFPANHIDGHSRVIEGMTGHLLAINHPRHGRAGTLFASDLRVEAEIFPQLSSSKTTYEFIALSLHETWIEEDCVDDSGWPAAHVSETGDYALPDFNVVRDDGDGGRPSAPVSESGDRTLRAAKGVGDDENDEEDDDDDDDDDDYDGDYCCENSYPLQVAVMLIGRTGRIARRIGIGFVALHKWIEAEPQWEAIILE